MDRATNRCLAHLRAFVESHGGSVNPQFLSQFYDLHPQARALFQPKPRVFIETHGHHHHLGWQYDRASNESTIIAGPRPAPTPTPSPTPTKDAIAVVRQLHGFIVARGGRLPTGMMQQFYSSMPTARSVMRPTARGFVEKHGYQAPGIELEWLEVGRDQWIVASTTMMPATCATTSTTNPRSQSQQQSVTSPPWRQCLELLDVFVKQRKNGQASMSDLGTFCVQHPSMASILRPGKKISSCKAFIDTYGKREGFQLTWRGNPPVVAHGTAPTNAPRQAPEQYIHVTTVAAATTIVQRDLRECDVLAIDMEGIDVPDRASLLQVAGRSTGVYIFDILACPTILTNASVGLGALLEDSSVVKVMHDGRHDAAALYGQFGISVVNVFDTQVAYCRLHNTRRLVGLNVVLGEYAGQTNSEKDSVQHRPGLWEQRPLPANLLNYAAQDVKFSIKAYDAMSDEMTAVQLQRCMQASIGRIKSALVDVAKAKTKLPTATQPAKSAAPNQRLSTLVRQHQAAQRDAGDDVVEIVDRDPDAFRGPIDENVTVRKRFTIKNHGSRIILLLRVALVAASTSRPFSLPLLISSPRFLDTGEQMEIPVDFRSDQPGSFRAVLTFKVETGDGKTVDIVRILDNVICVGAKTTASVRAMIQESATTRRHKRNGEHTRPGKVIDSFSFQGRDLPELVVQIGQYKIPPTLDTVPKPAAPVQQATYVNEFQRMLWLEERQHHIEQQDYDMVGAVLQPAGRAFRLAVPGLAESRPSVLAGDKVLLVHKAKTYQARATDVTRDDVVLGVPGSFASAYHRHDRVDVRFCLTRTPMRLCHQGIVAFNAAIHGKFLFPVKPLGPSYASIGRHDLQYTRELNPEQMQVVCDLQGFDKLTAPYIIYGPPGTGKTTTLVESIVQIAVAKRAMRILLCAATNTAADLLVDRLSTSIPTHSRMLRVMGAMRKQRDTLPSVLPFTLTDGAGGFDTPRLDALLNPTLQIVVATLGTAAKLHNYGLRRGHFDFVAVDEAGQATEPEVMSVLGPLGSPTTALILAGDPQQLGPVIKSAAASQSGLGVSLLERLVRLPVYRDASMMTGLRVMTKLRRNYRAHPALLSVPSSLFYDNSLIACASATTCRGFENWHDLPKRGVPLLFHTVLGHDSQDANSPSWYNPLEIAAMFTYVESLLLNGAGIARRVVPTDIGIITPYAKQRTKIHQVLRASGIDGVRVGSVEQFQGTELPVILVSTVRSSRDFFDEDAKFNLGFLGNPKRFNVAITRAQSLLIVVGNPLVLEADPNWRTLLQYCRAQGVWKGVRTATEDSTVPPPRPDMMDASSLDAASCAVM